MTPVVPASVTDADDDKDWTGPPGFDVCRGRTSCSVIKAADARPLLAKATVSATFVCMMIRICRSICYRCLVERLGVAKGPSRYVRAEFDSAIRK